MRTKTFFIVRAASVLLLFAAAAQAQQGPRRISYQGQLLEAGGTPASGNLAVDFAIFDVATDGTALYTENQNITVTDGILDARIGSVTPIPEDLFDDVPRYLEVTVDGTALTPRRKFTSAPYAFNSLDAVKSVTAGTGLTGGGAAGNVTLEIAEGGVISRNILDGTISSDDLGPNSVDSQEIVAGEVGSDEIARGAVGTSEIANGAVTRPKILDGAVGSRELADLIDLGEANSADGQLHVFSSLVSDKAVELGTFSSGAGRVRTFNNSGNKVTELSVNGANAGWVEVSGLNGEPNVKITSLAGFANRGYIAVYDDFGTNKAGMYVDGNGRGVVYGDTKNFRMPHPHQADKEIWYACTEGPEAAAYLRGTARLKNGRAEVTFPEHFQIVANGETMTVHLTPLDAGSLGLAVASKKAEGFRVRELAQGKGNYEFDWEVKSVRKGYEDYRVMRKKSEMKSAGPMKMTKTK